MSTFEKSENTGAENGGSKKRKTKIQVKFVGPENAGSSISKLYYFIKY